jgi:serine/threonine-protein kinase HipA
MSESKREAQVLVNGKLAGILSECSYGHFVFQYDEEYLKSGSPIGRHFPLTPKPFEHPELHPLFDNLASEGWLRRVQSENSNVDLDDTFGLLLANGKSLIGALSIIPK